ncbi:MAG: thioredoxin family protein [Candidatus Euphemobacter frigidus]|nr:thioredoxin family protein [Candidatus Euphemobacter frigidus]MDP8276663.1 thioredoxin family protein [Candidatus Euphemobacter frigidus]
MKIEVLGTGCPKCHKTRENIETALSESGKEAEIIEVKDLKSIADYGVMMTPAVVVDGEVKIVGKVPSVEQIKALLS